MTKPSPSTVEVHDAMIEAEEALSLFDVSARGRRYWPWIRNAVFGKALTAHGLLGKRHASWTDRPLREFLSPLTHSPRDVLGRLSWRGLDHADLLVFSHNRQIETPAGFVCPYTGPVLARSSQERWVMQATHNGVMAMPPAEARTKYLELPTLLHGAASMARPLRHRLSRGERHDLGDWAEALSKRLDVDLPTDEIREEAQYAIHEDEVRKGFYPGLLDRVKPRAIIIVVHYSRRCMPMTEVARERGIPVVEIQHGLLGPTHLAYNYAPGRCPDIFPDYLLTFGDFWERMTPGLPLPTERCLPIGFQWLEDQRKAERPARAKADGPETLLFLSQGSIGDELSRIALETADALDPSRWRIRYRLHPGERPGWKKRYPQLAASNIEVDEATGSVHSAFAESAAQVGVYSTAIYEGVSHGLRTLVADLPGWEGARPLVDSGAATRVGDAAAILTALELPEPSRELRLDLWADEPTRRFEEAISKIMDSGTCR